MIFYTLVYEQNEKTIRMLFNSELKRANYIEEHDLTDYVLGEIDTDTN